MKNYYFFISALLAVSNYCFATIYINNGTLGSTSSPTSYSDETIDVTGYLRLIGTITFTNCTFVMNSNSEILMTEPTAVIGPPPEGLTSYVNNVVTLSNCILDRTGTTGTWKGINVAYSSILYFQDNSILRNAEIGINCAYGSHPTIKQSTISNCQDGINIPNLDSRFNTHPNAITYLRAFFGNLITNCSSNGLKISNVKQNIKIGNLGQTENNFTNSGIGLNILNSNVTVVLTNFSGNETGVKLETSGNSKFSYRCEINGSGSTSTTFNLNTNFGIVANGKFQQLLVKSCKFNMNTERAIDISGFDDGFIIVQPPRK